MDIAFQLKGRLFTLSMLHLMTTSLEAIEQLLIQKIKQAPQFFNRTPVVIDLQEIEEKLEELDLDALRGLLKKYGIIPLGFRAAGDKAQSYLQDQEYALFKEARSTGQPPGSREQGSSRNKNSQISARPANSASKSERETIIIDKHVRSGQQVYAPDGDLIVLASVSAGAELLAEGNIHVYGTLRGRALAGINGDVEARIICNSLQAQLVSVAGQYKLLEEVSQVNFNETQQVFLKDGQLVIATVPSTKR